MDHITNKNRKSTSKLREMQTKSWEKIFAISSKVFMYYIYMIQKVFIYYIYDRREDKNNNKILNRHFTKGSTKWPTHVRKTHLILSVITEMQSKSNRDIQLHAHTARSLKLGEKSQHC